MSAIDPAAFARLLAGYCLDVRAGQQVVVASTTLAAPLLLALQRELLEREAWPLLRVELPGQAEGFWESACDLHLDAVSPAALAEAQGTDASLRIQAPTTPRRSPASTRPLRRAPPGPRRRCARRCSRAAGA